MSASDPPSLRRFAKALREHSVGICNFAHFPITTARVEAGNDAVGMIRKRARGLVDQFYFKLKIRQSATPDGQVTTSRLVTGAEFPCFVSIPSGWR